MRNHWWVWRVESVEEGYRKHCITERQYCGSVGDFGRMDYEAHFGGLLIPSSYFSLATFYETKAEAKVDKSVWYTWKLCKIEVEA